MIFLFTNNICSLVFSPTSKNIGDYKKTYKIKFNSYGSINHYNAHIVT